MERIHNLLSALRWRQDVWRRRATTQALHFRRYSTLCALFLGILVFAEPSLARAETQFGFNYWPEGYRANVVYEAWPAARSQVEADANHMASLGTRVVRLVVGDNLSGFNITQGNGGGLTSAHATFKNNFPGFIQTLCERDIQVIVAFQHNYHWFESSTPGLTWWQWAYGDSSIGFTNYIQTVKAWMDGIIGAVQSSPQASCVVYYDLYNEISETRANMHWFASYLSQWISVPSAKKGFSILRYPEDSNLVQSQVANLSYLDFHVYPHAQLHTSLESVYAALVPQFPGATVLMGEMGSLVESDSDEPAQAETILQLFHRAKAVGIPYALNWNLWDDSGALNFGFGASHDNPRHLLGAWSADLGQITNPDMELPAASAPYGWSVGGAVTPNLSRVVNVTDAATGTAYARVRSTSQGAVWLTSSWIDIQTSDALFANAYVRSNMRDIYMSLYEYDAQGQYVGVTASVPFTPTSWRWQSLQHASTPVGFAPQPTTRRLLLVFAASAKTSQSTHYLDVDAVSLSAR